MKPILNQNEDVESTYRNLGDEVNRELFCKVIEAYAKRAIKLNVRLECCNKKSEKYPKIKKELEEILDWFEGRDGGRLSYQSACDNTEIDADYFKRKLYEKLDSDRC